MFLFDEQQDVTIGAGDRCRQLAGEGQRRGGDVAGGVGALELPDPRRQDRQHRPGLSFQGSHTFDDPVVGLIYSANRLDQSDERIGIPGDGTTSGLDYEASASAREFETNNAPGRGNYSAVVSGDGLTVTFHTGQTIGADEVRVLTGTVPEPATITGTKFHDQNRDGVHDAGDPGLANWTIRAYTDANQNQQLDAGETTDRRLRQHRRKRRLFAHGRGRRLRRLRGAAVRLGAVRSPAARTAARSPPSPTAGTRSSLDAGESVSGQDFGNRRPRVMRRASKSSTTKTQTAKTATWARTGSPAGRSAPMRTQRQRHPRSRPRPTSRLGDHHLHQRRLQPQPRPRRLRRLRGLQGRGPDRSGSNRSPPTRAARRDLRPRADGGHAVSISKRPKARPSATSATGARATRRASNSTT